MISIRTYRSITLSLLLLVLAFASPLWATEQVTVVAGCDNARAWSTRRDEARMSREFSIWKMSIDPNGHKGSCLRLDFVPKLGSCDIWSNVKLNGPITSIGAWVLNSGREPIQFTLNLVESDGSIYSPQSVAIVVTGKWQYVSFPINSLHVAPWSNDENKQLDFPTAQIVAVFSGSAVGHEVTAKMDSITVTSPELKPLKLISCTLPTKAKPGYTIKVSLKVDPIRQVNTYCELRLVNRETIVFSKKLDTTNWIPGQANTIGPVEIKLPARMWPGHHDVVLYAPLYQLKQHPGNIVGSVNVAAPVRKTQKYSVRTINGTPQVFEGNNQLPMMGYMYEKDNREQVKAFGKIGMHLYWLEVRQMGWVGNGEYDYKLIDTMMADLFADDPEARVIPWFYVDLASILVGPEDDWWQQKHPDELCQDIDGKVFERNGHKTVSFASEIWRKESSAAMAKLVRHLENSPFADRIVGYQPCAGGSYEWMYHGGQNSVFLDYSKPTERRFRTWLKQRYGTDAALQSAWGEPKASLASAMIPTPEMRLRTENGSLRNPKTEKAVIDFTEFMANLTTDTIDYFCRTIKRETKQTKIAGVFYGYVMEQFYGGYSTQHTAHFDLTGILRRDSVDYLMSPTSYWNRQAGGTGGYMSAIASTRLHNKVWFDQADNGTFLSNPAFTTIRDSTEQQSIGVQRREVAMYMAAGSPVYWYSFGIPWYAGSDRMMAGMGKLASLTYEAQKTPSSLGGNRLAVIISDSAAAYSSLLSEPLRSAVYLQREALHRSGVQFDVYLDSDLGNPKMPKYKAYLFLDSLHLSQSKRAWIETHLKSDGRVLAWVWAPGITTDALDVHNSSTLTGINLKVSDISGIVTVTPEAGSGAPYGSEGAFSPIILPDDAQAQLIGNLSSPAALLGQPGAVVKKFPTWNSVYSAAPHLNPAMIRGIARLAGVPVYSDDDQPIYIGPNTIGLHGTSTSERTVVLPRAAKVINAFSGEVIGENITRFTAKIAQYDTEMFIIK